MYGRRDQQISAHDTAQERLHPGNRTGRCVRGCGRPQNMRRAEQIAMLNERTWAHHRDLDHNWNPAWPVGLRADPLGYEQTRWVMSRLAGKSS
jgi:hypothetical protein